MAKMQYSLSIVQVMLYSIDNKENDKKKVCQSQQTVNDLTQ